VTALRLALVFSAILALAHPHLAAALGDTDVKAGACSVASGGNATNNTITCNFGLTPEQLREATKAAVAGATEPLLDRIDKVRNVLGVTRSAAEKLLKIAGEQPDVPDEKLAEVLTSVAADYQRLKAQAAALNPDNPTARALVAQAKAAIEAGQLAQAHEQLRQATQVQIAAAQEARKLRQQAQAAEDAELLGAAASTATEGDLAMTERYYQQAADLFNQAAELVPAGHRDETTRYLERQAIALYREGDERGDNAALKQSIETWHLVLQQRPRERVPLDWARTQMNLGLALWRLGERESGTARLEEAVTAYRAALEEWTRERVPLDWAMSTGNQGVALMVIAERLGDVPTARSAVQQIEVAFATMRDGGNAPAAAYYEAQLPKARSLLDRLTSRSQ
jgi:tetratricopeptide (TPR) repeat protein